MWSAAEDKIRKERGYPNNKVVKSKNNLLIAGVIEELAAAGVFSKVLDDVGDRILKFAEAAHG